MWKKRLVSMAMALLLAVSLPVSYTPLALPPNREGGGLGVRLSLQERKCGSRIGG